MSYLIFPRIPCGIDMIGNYEIQIFFKNNPDHIIATISPYMLPGINQYTNAHVCIDDDGDDIEWRVISKRNRKIIDIKLDTPELQHTTTKQQRDITPDPTTFTPDPATFIPDLTNRTPKDTIIEQIVKSRLAIKYPNRTIEQRELHNRMLYRITRPDQTSQNNGERLY